jgi:hypothetical protein
MALIGMGEAAKRAKVSGTNAIRIALVNAKVPLVRISDRAFAVEESDLRAFIDARGGELRPGRPKKVPQPD